MNRILLSFCVLYLCLFGSIALPFRKPTLYGDIWKNCGSSTDHFSISNVTITPDPPVIGENLTISISGTLDETITGGNAYVWAKWKNILVYNHTYDLCSTVSKWGINCPIQKGPLVAGVSETIPNVVPHGAYTCQLSVNDMNDERVLCIALNLKL